MVEVGRLALGRAPAAFLLFLFFVESGLAYRPDDLCRDAEENH
jgi:hypothetical protein